MANLIYSAIASLDGYTEDAGGEFGWAAPDEEVHAFVNDLERPIGTYLYGRRMYETMVFWQDPPDLESEPPVFRDYAAIWQGAEKIVYSTTLSEPVTPRTRVEGSFDPAAVRELKDSSERDLGIGGPTLAAHALAAGLVDECHLFLHPVVVGGGKPAFGSDGQIGLELLEQQRFESGVVYLRYRAGAR